MTQARIKITQVRSIIGRPEKHRRIIEALGIRRNQSSVVHNDTPQIRGMAFKVRHLVTVEEVK
ncbi:MAG: 50S ribosomal protein L30 [bacterium]|jgi:large subunit ribosomal protein L30|nr:50S ribosomal protein L30 [bacterium]MBK7045223.1 50S ribosomal protein L30 [bacterium]MBK7187843.1 50S ribosomal protein L30 [bacterium]MBK7672301.1 50S ribosomal protein L30 [bacterium]MBK7768989.1 50S ribosomal protein L30 [bacterium]